MARVADPAAGSGALEAMTQAAAAVTGTDDVAGFGVPPKPDFWIAAGTANRPPIHIAFRVSERGLVSHS